MGLVYRNVEMETFEIELPDGVEDEIEAYLGEESHNTNENELIEDAIRHLLYSEHSTNTGRRMYIN